jgi:anthranilate synthase component 1
VTPPPAPSPDGGFGGGEALAFNPDPAEFAALAKEHTIVPVWCEVVADTLTPVACFANVVGDGDGFLFESVEGGERWGRYSFVGRRPLATLTARGRHVEATGRLGLGASDDGILAAVEALVTRFESPALTGLPPLHGGLVGYLGYDVVREVERLPDPPVDDAGHPDAALVVIGQFCAFDHWRQRIVLIDNVVVPEAPDGVVDTEAVAVAYASACARLEELAADCAGRDPGAPPSPSGRLLAAPPPGLEKAEAARTMTSEQYRACIAAAKEYIKAGDIFQVVLSQRYDLTLDAEPFDVYRALRLLNPSPYLYFLRFPEVTVVGASPEPMVRLRDGVVISRPIAGSRPRGESEQHDRLLEAELIEDPKELAEHIMLVDLARNDVGRVVRFGTEKVDELMTIERYSHIMHITSQVSGELREGKGPIDVLRATLPAGTLSGAPKVRAMEIIDELEVTKRGVYGGVVGYIDFSGNVDTAIAIRTMVVMPDGRASVQAGAGIVADSDPVSEDEECAYKAGALLVAVTAARRMGAARRGSLASSQEQQQP